VTGYKKLTSRKAVFAAIAECERLGPDRFRGQYGFDAAQTYFLQYQGKRYDSKAIVGVAYGYQFPAAGWLKSGDFSGGKGHAAGHLSRLGFLVEGISPRQVDWTLAEVEAIVAIYFRMFQLQSRADYSRRAHLDAALEQLAPRNESAVSRKLSNISAILRGFGLPVLRGFGPLGNKQTLLAAVVIDWLSDHPEIFDAPPSVASPPPLPKESEVDPPQATLLDSIRGERRACRIDFADRDERNRALGRLGEKWAVELLKSELSNKGRADLAARVVWVSDELGDGLGFDIASFQVDGSPLMVEVKTSNGSIGAPFIVSSNEVAVSASLKERYMLMRVLDLQNIRSFTDFWGPWRKLANSSHGPTRRCRSHTLATISAARCSRCCPVSGGQNEPSAGGPR
jgi:hypothetical protein